MLDTAGYGHVPVKGRGRPEGMDAQRPKHRDPRPTHIQSMDSVIEDKSVAFRHARSPTGALGL